MYGALENVQMLRFLFRLDYEVTISTCFGRLSDVFLQKIRFWVEMMKKINSTGTWVSPVGPPIQVLTGPNVA